MEVNKLQNIANKIRVNCLDSICCAGSGHPGGSFSSAEIMAALYFRQMNIKIDDPYWEKRDRFVLSKGHVAPVLYTTLALRGFFPVSELKSLRKLGSRLLGHPAYQKLPGIDMVSGSLGQGLSVGLGMRLAGRQTGNNFKTYVLMGDGEIQEGQIWEAAMAASHYKINNLIGILDYNGVQLDGTIKEIMEIDPVEDKWKSFGWKVLNVDGHNVSDLIKIFDQAEKESLEGPVIVIAKTVKGKGVSFMENKAAWHGKAPVDSEKEQAFNELHQCLKEGGFCGE